MNREEPELKRNLGIATGVCQCVSFIGEVWYKQPGTIGHRRVSGQAVVGLGLLFIAAAFSYSSELMTFWAATICWMLFHKFAYGVRQRKGFPRPHSRFVGVSLLSFLGGNVVACRFWEPLLTFVVGYMLIQSGKGYGGTIVLIAIAMFFSAGYSAAANKAQLDALKDARAEQEWLAEAARKD